MYPQRSVMTCGLATALEPPHFNPRTRVGCDAALKVKATNQIQLQSPHPRGVRQRGTAKSKIEQTLSIHAPAWGATQHIGQQEVYTKVSIHAPAWGATPTARPRRPIQRKFQSTHPRGVRRCCRCPSGCPSRCFNPRTRVGCDAKAIADKDREYLFQSTHPRGVRHAASAGRDPQTGVSIHAPAWGATSRPAVLWCGLWFQSTHPRGVRLVFG